MLCLAYVTFETVEYPSQRKFKPYGLVVWGVILSTRVLLFLEVCTRTSLIHGVWILDGTCASISFSCFNPKKKKFVAQQLSHRICILGCYDASILVSFFLFLYNILEK